MSMDLIIDTTLPSGRVITEEIYLKVTDVYEVLNKKTKPEQIAEIHKQLTAIQIKYSADISKQFVIDKVEEITFKLQDNSSELTIM